MLCAKSTFFSVSGQAVEQNKRSQSLGGFQHHKGENLFCLQFSDPIIVGLKRWTGSIDQDCNNPIIHVI